MTVALAFILICASFIAGMLVSAVSAERQRIQYLEELRREAQATRWQLFTGRRQ